MPWRLWKASAFLSRPIVVGNKQENSPPGHTPGWRAIGMKESERRTGEPGIDTDRLTYSRVAAYTNLMRTHQALGDTPSHSVFFFFTSNHFVTDRTPCTDQFHLQFRGLPSPLSRLWFTGPSYPPYPLPWWHFRSSFFLFLILIFHSSPKGES